MRIIFNIISILMVTTVIFLAYLNINTGLSFIVWKSLSSPSFLVYHSRFFSVILIVFIFGMLVGSSWASAYYAPLQSKLKEYQRKLERRTIQTADDSSRVAVLEEKVKVLEKALQAALENKENNEQG